MTRGRIASLIVRVLCPILRTGCSIQAWLSRKDENEKMGVDVCKTQLAWSTSQIFSITPVLYCYPICELTIFKDY